eukprot:NODE_4809_length_1110_cov_44.940223_g4268_i0.p1 GENE.NODE_4809_length_1110_cov_44.940223_g4268_i0~~NODE_4809_length_1110_cov_44.940223_g4268_i0.p1  ORF type:complete len:340 (+),score=13.48 NODE_4809_length_1110_cov_44.940223_g4268_i0:51-1022(+)
MDFLCDLFRPNYKTEEFFKINNRNINCTYNSKNRKILYYCKGAGGLIMYLESLFIPLEIISHIVGFVKLELPIDAISRTSVPSEIFKEYAWAVWNHSYRLHFQHFLKLSNYRSGFLLKVDDLNIPRFPDNNYESIELFHDPLGLTLDDKHDLGITRRYPRHYSLFTARDYWHAMLLRSYDNERYSYVDNDSDVSVASKYKVIRLLNFLEKPSLLTNEKDISECRWKYDNDYLNNIGEYMCKICSFFGNRICVHIKKESKQRDYRTMISKIRLEHKLQSRPLERRYQGKSKAFVSKSCNYVYKNRIKNNRSNGIPNRSIPSQYM